jgi:hypothetical protein
MDTASAPANSGEEWILRAITTADKRLFWTLNGALEGAIQVAPSEYYEPGVFASMEPYFGPDGSPHAVSQASLMEPRCRPSPSASSASTRGNRPAGHVLLTNRPLLLKHLLPDSIYTNSS